MNLERTIDENGRYLGYFDTKEEAQEFIDKQVNRYLFTPNPDDMSVRSLCQEAQDKGIGLYPNTFGQELKRRGIDIRNTRPRETKKKTRTFSFSQYALDQLDEYPKGSKSFIANLGLKIALGIPTENVIMFLPDEDGEVTLIFRYRGKNRIQLYISGNLDMKFEVQLRNLLSRAEKQGMQEIVKYAEQNGYRYCGGTETLQKEE